MSIKYIAGALVATALAVPTLALSATDANAKHGGSTVVRVTGTCTDVSTAKLKAKQDDGRIEVEFEVDSNRRGQRWTAGIVDNGAQVWSGSRKTRGRSASFSIEKRIANQAGADVITATATNRRTGETCTATLTYTN